MHLDTDLQTQLSDLQRRHRVLQSAFDDLQIQMQAQETFTTEWLEQRKRELQAEAQEQQKAEKLQNVFYRIAERATAGLTFYEFLQSVHGLLNELLYAKNCYVCLHHASSNLNDFPYYVDERDGDTLQHYNVPYRRGLTEFVLRSAQTQIIDAARLRALYQSGEVTEGTGDLTFSSWLGVPMTIHGRVGGALVVQSYEAGIAYSAEDAGVLSYVANHVSSAIERYQALDQLRKSEARYRSVIENVGVGVVVVQDEMIVFANPSLVRIVGHPLEYLLSEPFTATIHPDDKPAMLERHQRRRRGETVEAQYSFRVITQTQEVRSLELSAVMIEWGQREATLLFVVDATARLQAEQAQLEAIQKQIQLNDMKSRFISTASHEFRTPLATIHGSVELLLHYDERLPLAKKQQTLQKIDDAVARMTHMLENVLIMGRTEAGGLVFMPRPTPVAQFFEDMLDELRGAMDQQFSKVLLNITLPEPTLVLMLDETLLRHIVGNLLSNALKYSPEGGELGLSVQAKGGEVVISVSDEGIGIPQADQVHLFESFHRASNVGNIAGTGLGLSIVQDAVRCHKGTIQVVSQINQGSCFTVRLPLVAQ